MIHFAQFYIGRNSSPAKLRCNGSPLAPSLDRLIAASKYKQGATAIFAKTVIYFQISDLSLRKNLKQKSILQSINFPE